MSNLSGFNFKCENFSELQLVFPPSEVYREETLEYAPSNEQKKTSSVFIYPYTKTSQIHISSKKCEYPGCKLWRDRDSIRYFGGNKIKVCIFHFYEAQCSKCFKFFTYKTLKKYDGITCGKCYKAT